MFSLDGRDAVLHTVVQKRESRFKASQNSLEALVKSWKRIWEIFQRVLWHGKDHFVEDKEITSTMTKDIIKVLNNDFNDMHQGKMNMLYNPSNIIFFMNLPRRFGKSKSMGIGWTISRWISHFKKLSDKPKKTCVWISIIHIRGRDSHYK